MWDTIYPFEIFQAGQLFSGAWAPDGIFVCGDMEVPGMAGWVVKLNFEGDSLWSRAFNGIGSRNLASTPNAVVTANGDLVGVGNLYVPGVSYILKVSTDGDLLWQECCPVTPFSGEISSDFLMLEDGSYLIAGYAYNEFDERVIRLTRTTPDIVSTSPTGELPSSIVLHANFPNPFNATTEIRFDLPRAVQTSLKVYDGLGREVAELAGGVMNAGAHTLTFDASALASGVYFYRLEAGEFGETRKMALLK